MKKDNIEPIEINLSYNPIIGSTIIINGQEYTIRPKT